MIFKKKQTDDILIITKSKNKPPKPPKPPKLPSEPKKINLVKLKVIRIIIYISLTFLMMKGIFAIIFPSDITSAKTELLSKLDAQTTNYNRTQDIKGFVESFGSVYLSYSKQDNKQKRIDRLSKYCDSRVAYDLVSDNREGQAEVLQTVALSVTQYSDNQYDVLMYADVIYRTLKQSETSDENAPPTEVVIQEDIYIQVPIYVSETGKMLIESVPLISSPPTAAPTPPNKNIYSNANNEDKNLAKTMLEGFLPVLFNGNQSQIDYYLSNVTEDIKNQFKPRNTAYKYNSLDSNTIYSLGNNRYIAIVSAKLIDLNGNTHIQKLSIELIKNNGRMYAMGISPRTENLKIS